MDFCNLTEVSSLVQALLLLMLISLAFYLYDVLWLRQEKVRRALREQGIAGPPPSLIHGNIKEMKAIASAVQKSGKSDDITITDDYSPLVFPYLDHWDKVYGEISSPERRRMRIVRSNFIRVGLRIVRPNFIRCQGHVFAYTTGTIPILYIGDPDMVRELSMNTSMELGRPSYLATERRALFGDGIFSSNGQQWLHLRKLNSAAFQKDKVKLMAGLMGERAAPFIDGWEKKVRDGGGEAVQLKMDEDLRDYSADVISAVFFGSRNSRCRDMFVKLWDLQNAMSQCGLLIGIPGMRLLPSKNNRKIWKLEREIRASILNSIKASKEGNAETTDLLNAFIDAVSDHHGSGGKDENFLLDNCKSLMFAGHETTAATATWTLALLAAHPQWQTRVRDEVREICGDRYPDIDDLSKMKNLTMVIQESLRLYPPAIFVVREALEEVRVGGIRIPRSTSIQIPLAPLHHDPGVWGPDAHEFNPTRFAEGASKSCKNPHVYMPFGMGPRVCLGQNFAIVELKVILSLILVRFSFCLSPEYRHCPAFRLVIQPKYGLQLLVKMAS